MYLVTSQPCWGKSDEEYNEAIEFFTDKINDRIDAGYVPCGVIIPVIYHDSLWWLHQPMIKKSIIDEEKKADKTKVEKQESEIRDQNVKTEAESKSNERNTYYGNGMGRRGCGGCGML